MDGWTWVWRGFEAVAVMVVVATVAGQLLGQPVLLGYVTSGSMAPTLQTGDGFVAIPSAVAGPVEEGDVVVFQAERLHGGGLTTHRVVAVTEDGYVTKGDANPFPDQDNEEPIVKEPQVVATVWQPGGRVLAIPHLGTLVMGAQGTLDGIQTRLAAAFGTRSLLGTQGLAYLVLALSGIGYVLDLWLGSSPGKGRRRQRQRGRETGTSARTYVAVFAAVVVVGATAAMVVPSGQEKVGVVSAESDAPGPGVIEQGTTETVDYPVGNGGVLPVVVVLESQGDLASVEPRHLTVPGRSAVNATLALSAPPETGYYRGFVVQHRYLAVLPASTIRGLHAVHPWAPVVVIDGLLGGGFYLLGITVLGTGRLRSRRREGTTRG